MDKIIKKLLMLSFCLMILSGALALAEDDPDEIEIIKEIVVKQEVTLDNLWQFPVSVEALQTDYLHLTSLANLLDADYEPDDLVYIDVRRSESSKIQMREIASKALSDMFAAADADGITLYAHSGYRSYRTQRTIYNNRLSDNNGKDDGVVAYPGSSDHQTGLGIGVISKAWIKKNFNSEFAKTKEAQWMAEHCAEYGFIIRYLEGKEDITGIIYEPWHLRYVGPEVAAYMMDNYLTLEEFTEQWQPLMAEYETKAAELYREERERAIEEAQNAEPIYSEDGEEEILYFDWSQ